MPTQNFSNTSRLRSVLAGKCWRMLLASESAVFSLALKPLKLRRSAQDRSLKFQQHLPIPLYSLGLAGLLFALSSNARCQWWEWEHSKRRWTQLLRGLLHGRPLPFEPQSLHLQTHGCFIELPGMDAECGMVSFPARKHSKIYTCPNWLLRCSGQLKGKEK